MLPQGQHFDRYDHEQVGWEDGGRAYATVNQRGEVAFHEGYLTRREAKKIAAGGNGSYYDLTARFMRLLALPDTANSEVIGIVMGETLAAGSAVVEAVGLEIGVDMARRGRQTRRSSS